MDLIQLKLCDIQGRLFELSLQAGYNSEDFMKQFMRSKVARDLEKNTFWKNLQTSARRRKRVVPNMIRKYCIGQAIFTAIGMSRPTNPARKFMRRLRQRP